MVFFSFLDFHFLLLDVFLLSSAFPDLVPALKSLIGTVSRAGYLIDYFRKIFIPLGPRFALIEKFQTYLFYSELNLLLAKSSENFGNAPKIIQINV